MLVIVSWYADGSGEPQVNFEKIRYQEGRGFYGLGALIEDIRNTKHKECRAWEVVSEDFHLLYDSTAPEKEGGK